MTQPVKTYENFQIIRVDGRDVFVEVMRSGFSIGKVILNFLQYDEKKAAGSRVKEEISVFVDIPEFLQLVQDMKSGRLSALAKISKETAAKGGYSFANAIYTNMGGTSAERLAQQGKSRPDGKDLSRQFKITPGSKAPWMLSAETGPGEKTDKGLIAPKYGSRPERIIRVPMSDDHFKRIFLMVELHLQAFITAEILATRK